MTLSIIRAERITLRTFITFRAKSYYIQDLYYIQDQKLLQLGPLLHLGSFITFEASQASGLTSKFSTVCYHFQLSSRIVQTMENCRRLSFKITQPFPSKFLENCARKKKKKIAVSLRRSRFTFYSHKTWLSANQRAKKRSLERVQGWLNSLYKRILFHYMIMWF